VLAVRDAYGETWIEARVPPSSHIARRDGDGGVHPVVSNVDTALLLMGLDDDFNPRRSSAISRSSGTKRSCPSSC
jgi:ribosome biogenesis GTPase